MYSAYKSPFVSLSLGELSAVSGGLNLDNVRPSENIEDRRPQSSGGPVPDDVWQKEQDDLQRERDTTCTPDDPYGEGGGNDGGYDDGGGYDDDGGGYEGGGEDF